MLLYLFTQTLTTFLLITTMGKPRVVSQFEGLKQQHQVLQNPPNLKQWRQRLYDVAEPLRLTKAEFNTYFPYISNV
jgi:hypothetical protein